MPAPTQIAFGTDGWRAVIAESFTYDNLRRVADAAGRVFAADHPGGTIYVGHDTRFEAESFAAAAAEVLASHGLTVKVTDRYIPTPGLCWSIANDDAAVGGVILTASHNPAPYLGFKIRMADGGASPVEFTNRVEAELRDEPPALRGGFEHVDLVTPYLAGLRSFVDAEAIAKTNLRVAVDPLFGAGQTYLAETLRHFGIEVLELHSTRNPGFGGLHPEPIPPHIDEAAEFVRANNLDAAFVTDGDADRIGAIDRFGNFVNPHRIICLVARHLAEDKGYEGRIVKTLSTSVLVDRLGAYLGREVTTTPVGFKWIYDQMLKGDVMIGGEESGGIGVPAHVKERDALLMSLMLAEMMGQRGKSLDGLVDELIEVTGPMEYRRIDLKLAAGTDAKALLAQIPASAPAEVAGQAIRETLTYDGVKFMLPDDAWLLLRASGTEPLVRIYAEAGELETVEALLAAGSAIVEGLL
ncbi:MAG TPA: phosphoglucosamine mutase [Coriobacteriia bacterium]|nr:phosphoglucosamine mutase [Coriobacteriia bacterium]